MIASVVMINEIGVSEHWYLSEGSPTDSLAQCAELHEVRVAVTQITQLTETQIIKYEANAHQFLEDCLVDESDGAFSGWSNVLLDVSAIEKGHIDVAGEIGCGKNDDVVVLPDLIELRKDGVYSTHGITGLIACGMEENH